jgi:hypothetical protein
MHQQSARSILHRLPTCQCRVTAYNPAVQPEFPPSCYAVEVSQMTMPIVVILNQNCLPPDLLYRKTRRFVQRRFVDGCLTKGITHTLCSYPNNFDQICGSYNVTSCRL